MTSTVASRRETAAALLFGASKESQEAAAQRDLGPHLRKNLGVWRACPRPSATGPSPRSSPQQWSCCSST